VLLSDDRQRNDWGNIAFAMTGTCDSRMVTDQNASPRVIRAHEPATLRCSSDLGGLRPSVHEPETDKEPCNREGKIRGYRRLKTRLHTEPRALKSLKSNADNESSIHPSRFA